MVFGITGWVDDFWICLGFMSQLPVRARQKEYRSLGAAMGALPVAGLVIGAIGALACLIAMALGLPGAVAALIAITVLLLVTGGLHEDGLADVADGFGGGVTEGRKLEIMKDSRIGSYGVLALICALLLKMSALTAILGAEPGGWAILAMFAALGGWSRTWCVLLMATTANARGEGLAADVGRPPPEASRLALITGAATTLFLLWSSFGFWTAFAVFAISGATFWLLRELSIRQIGGHTGDVAGAVQVATETAMLVTLAAAI